MKNILYILPFIFFIMGYTTLSWLTRVHSIAVPSLVGIPLVDAIKTLSSLQLNVRIVGFQEEVDLPAGTIMSHVPTAGSLIKSHQRILMVVSKNPELLEAPSFITMSCDQAEIIAQKQGIRLKKNFMTNALYPLNTIIAQWPSKGQPLSDKTIIVYCSRGEASVVVVPDLRGRSVHAVETFCERNQIALEVISMRASAGRASTGSDDSNHPHEEHIVKHQRPLAGSLVDVNKGLKFQISIEKV